MLDIEIFSVEEPIYLKGKKIGKVPHISLGSYTKPTPDDQKVINSFYDELSPAHRSIFSMMIHTLGQTFFADSLARAIDDNHHPLARQKMLNLLRRVYPENFVSSDSLKAKQNQILHTLHENFRPTHMVAMMMDMKGMHDESLKAGKIDPIHDEIFARGIARCVQSIQDLPEKEKTPQIQRLCKRGTHRWKNFKYER
ncbi:MAG: hypothetical protein II942_00035 [Alphaproteobacteria bacterium]|nr:hypothetical protein [Alphaproteobacteria bacterium]